MSRNAQAKQISIQHDAGQALGLMAGAVFTAALIGQGASGPVLGIISSCMLLMVLITGSLFLLEGRMDEMKRGALQVFCVPAVTILGFSCALLMAAGIWSLAFVVLAVAFAFAAYRRFLTDGAFNLIPSAAMDVGVLGGVGATLAGFALFLSAALVA